MSQKWALIFIWTHSSLTALSISTFPRCRVCELKSRDCRPVLYILYEYTLVRENDRHVLLMFKLYITQPVCLIHPFCDENSPVLLNTRSKNTEPFIGLYQSLTLFVVALFACSNFIRSEVQNLVRDVFYFMELFDHFAPDFKPPYRRRVEGNHGTHGNEKYSKIMKLLMVSRSQNKEILRYLSCKTQNNHVNCMRLP